MSGTQRYDPDESASTISGVGSSTMSALDVETVGDLATTETSDAVNAVEDKSGIKKEDVTRAIKDAKAGLGLQPHLSPEQVKEEIGYASSTRAVTATEDILASRLDTIDDDPDDEFTIALVAGNDSFEQAKNKATRTGRADEFDATATVMMRFMEASLLDDDGNLQADKIVTVDPETGSSAGSEWGLLWYQYARNETDDNVPELELVGINADQGQIADWDGSDWGQAYAERRERVLDEANFLLVVENGDGVGRWVTAAQDAGIDYDAPPLPDDYGSDESEDGADDGDGDADDNSSAGDAQPVGDNSEDLDYSDVEG